MFMNQPTCNGLLDYLSLFTNSLESSAYIAIEVAVKAEEGLALIDCCLRWKSRRSRRIRRQPSPPTSSTTSLASGPAFSRFCLKLLETLLSLGYDFRAEIRGTAISRASSVICDCIEQRRVQLTEHLSLRLRRRLPLLVVPLRRELVAIDP